MGLRPKGASLSIAGEEEVKRQSREQISPKNGKNDGIWIAARDPDSFCEDPPANTATVSGFSYKIKP